MARTLQFSGTLTWPLEDGKQAAVHSLAFSLVYASALYVEKPYSVAAVDEDVALPMTSAKALLVEAGQADLQVKLNSSTVAITVKAGTGFMLIVNPDGAITGVKVSTTAVPATLKMYVFA
jgi:hypothetical protein